MHPRCQSPLRCRRSTGPCRAPPRRGRRSCDRPRRSSRPARDRRSPRRSGRRSPNSCGRTRPRTARPRWTGATIRSRGTRRSRRHRDVARHGWRPRRRQARTARVVRRGSLAGGRADRTRGPPEARSTASLRGCRRGRCGCVLRARRCTAAASRRRAPSTPRSCRTGTPVRRGRRPWSWSASRTCPSRAACGRARHGRGSCRCRRGC